MHQAQLCALGCIDALTAKVDDDIKIGISVLDISDINSEQLRAAHQAWVSLITTYKGVAFNIVQAVESPGEAWSRLVEYYRVSGLKERRSLTVDSCKMKMELGKHT